MKKVLKMMIIVESITKQSRGNEKKRWDQPEKDSRLQTEIGIWIAKLKKPHRGKK